VPDTIDLSGPAHIPAAAVSNPAVAAAAEAAAAAQRDSSGSEAAPDSDEDIEPEEMQAALTKQQEADQVAREEVKVPDECRKDWRAAMQWAMCSTVACYSRLIPSRAQQRFVHTHGLLISQNHSQISQDHSQMHT
jgi:hypothetical protein